MFNYWSAKYSLFMRRIGQLRLLLVSEEIAKYVDKVQ